MLRETGRHLVWYRRLLRCSGHVHIHVKPWQVVRCGLRLRHLLRHLRRGWPLLRLLLLLLLLLTTLLLLRLLLRLREWRVVVVLLLRHRRLCLCRRPGFDDVLLRGGIGVSARDEDGSTEDVPGLHGGGC